MAVALVGLSAAMVSLAKGSRPGLPAGEQHWSSGWAGGSAKWHPVHPSSSCGMPQQPEKKGKLGLVPHYIKAQRLRLQKL